MGLSMTGINSNISLSREALFRALQTRACFGVSRPGITIDFKAESGNSTVSQGEILKIEDDNIPSVKLKADADSPVDYVALVYDGSEYFRIAGNGALTVETVKMIPEKLDYLYARVRLRDGNMAWSSPIWFDYD